MFSRTASWAQELRPERTAIAYQQGRRPLPEDVDGTRRALHSRALWTGQRSAALGAETGRAGRKECQETSGGSRGPEVGGTAAQVVGERGSLRATAEQPQSGKRSGLVLVSESRAQPPSSGDCAQVLVRLPSKRWEPRSIHR